MTVLNLNSKKMLNSIHPNKLSSSKNIYRIFFLTASCRKIIQKKISFDVLIFLCEITLQECMSKDSTLKCSILAGKPLPTCIDLTWRLVPPKCPTSPTQHSTFGVSILSPQVWYNKTSARVLGSCDGNCYFLEVLFVL